jgi:hypothetical protein
MLTWWQIPVPGGTTRSPRNADCPQRRNWYRSRLRRYSSSILRSSTPGRPKWSAITEWSITSSAGRSGLILAGSPPSPAIASRMTARSTMHGTPVKSCISTRAGVNWISADGCAAGSHPASASIWAAVTIRPSSFRSRFSSSTFRLNGSRAQPATRLSRTISYVASPTVSRSRAPKLLLVNLSSWMADAAQGRQRRLPGPGSPYPRPPSGDLARIACRARVECA